MASAPRKKPATRRPTRQPTREQILRSIRQQADHAARIDDPEYGDIGWLKFLLKAASPRAKSVFWRGVRFPIRRGLLIDSVRCPDTGRGLVGVVA